ncbi:hypothetical protein K7X08_015252 [Anisodus acutangulus]|uniref:Phospholipase A1 n=1 Tax=Anisodus acutangulus TaxID=402998 RepID=A0A9Q1L578_9SOLA|nr:hypothetical protein K7X08_015252 [Anisodus acutangulus]
MGTEPTWHEFLGSNNWEVLLQPLNLTLRQLTLWCGDFCQATYDAFNNDQNSKYCVTSRYGHSLGASLATLAAFDVVENGVLDIPKVSEFEGLERDGGLAHLARAGWNGEDEEFELRGKRSVALVNKSSSFLKDEYLIPGSWWVERNKGMVLDENGEWILAPPSDEDLPVPEY